MLRNLTATLLLLLMIAAVRADEAQEARRAAIRGCLATYDGEPQPYAIARIDNKLYRIDLVKLSKWRWRISSITRCEEQG